MAIYPCSVGEHRYAGPQRSFYATAYFDGDPDRRKLRLCEPHWLVVQAHLVEYEIADDGVSTGDPAAVGRCASCLQPLQERGIQLFVTCYPAKDERKDYWLQIHAQCTVPPWFPTRF